MISQYGIMSKFAVMVYVNCLLSHVQYLPATFSWLTLTSELATKSQVFSWNFYTPSSKPSVLLKKVPFLYLMTISTSFSCLLGILAFLSAIAKVRTPVVVCADIGSAVQCFVLNINCSPLFKIHFDLPKSPTQEGRVSGYPPLLNTLERTLRVLVSFGF